MIKYLRTEDEVWKNFDTTIFFMEVQNDGTN